MIYSYENPNVINEDEFFIVLDESQPLQEISFFDQIDKWRTSNENHSVQHFKSTSISDKDYEKLNICIKEMKQSEDYSVYKKAFDRFCYFCHVMPRGVILKKYELTKGKPDHNSLYVEYSYNTKKIELPENITLYHMSKVKGIKELLPVFRGKAARGFLYDKSRIYFTIRKHMPKFLADYKFKDKLHMYKCKQKIKYAYVDPLVWSNIQGAVYIETNKPIPVEEINKQDVEKAKEQVQKEKEENKEQVNSESAEFDFDNFFNFVTENGLILNEE